MNRLKALTSRHNMHYNDSIVINNELQADNKQLTIRGLSSRTHRLLRDKARSSGVSVNSLVLQKLQQVTGSETHAERRRRMLETLHKHRIPAEDLKIAKRAIKKHKQDSIEKQKREFNDAGN